jgi:hypothetical protein
MLVAHIAKGDDVLTWPAGVLEQHTLAGVHGRRASDVGSGEKDNAIVIFANTEVEGTSALIVGRLERGDGEAKCGCERLAELRDGVSEGVEREELRASCRPGHLGLPESDLDLREAGQAEDVLDALGHSHGTVIKE